MLGFKKKRKIKLFMDRTIFTLGTILNRNKDFQFEKLNFGRKSNVQPPMIMHENSPIKFHFIAHEDDVGEKREYFSPFGFCIEFFRVNNKT